MSTEAPTLQAVIDALVAFHRCYEFSAGDIGPHQMPPGEEAGAAWTAARDLMVARGTSVLDAMMHEDDFAPPPLSTHPPRGGGPPLDPMDGLPAWKLGPKKGKRS